MALIGEAAFKRDLRQGLIPPDQQACPLNPLRDEPGIWRDAGGFSEGFYEVAGGKSANARHLGYAHLLGQPRSQEPLGQFHLPIRKHRATTKPVGALARHGVATPKWARLKQDTPGRNTALARVHAFPVAIATSYGMQVPRSSHRGIDPPLCGHHRQAAGKRLQPATEETL